MKEIVVLSGKGGTGKTSIAAALAHLASRQAAVVMADADVDAANLGLVLAPRTVAEHDFFAGKLAVVANDRCTGCGTCAEACRFAAIRLAAGKANGKTYCHVDPVACEGCAACFYRCPAGAISMEEQAAGRWFVAETRFGPLVHAHLLAGRENSGKLVTLVKQQARELARGAGGPYLLVDGPPGIGCPVIAACAGADLALLVTEPTVAAAHDLERALATVRHFGVPALVCINKYDLNRARTREIERFCASQGVEMVGRIPYDNAVTEAMVRGRALTEQVTLPGFPGADGGRAGETAAEEMSGVWVAIKASLTAQKREASSGYRPAQ